MTRKTFKKLFITTSCAVLMATSLSFGMEETKQLEAQSQRISVTSRDKATQNFVAENLEAIETMRTFYRNHGEEALVEHHDVLIPFALRLLETMNQGQKNPHIEKLQKEVKRILEDREVSSIWLLGMHVRYLSLLGDPTEKEIALFDHTPSKPGYFKAFLKKDIYRNPAVLNIYKIASHLAYADHKDRYVKNPYIPELSDQIRKQIKEELKKQLPLQILYPMLGEGIFNPRFIINCWMDEIYPIGMPTQDVKDVHGEQATPLSFAYHDWFHYEIDTRRRSLKTYIQLEVAESVKNGVWASDIIPTLVPLAVQKYTLVMDALKRVTLQLSEDKHAFTGLFFMVHEFSSFSPELFKIQNPSEIVNAMLKGSSVAFSEDESWENPKDILRTNPIDGRTFLTQTEIKDAAIDRIAQDGKLNIYAPYPPEIYNKVDAENNIIGYVTETDQQKQLRKNWLMEKKNSRIEITKSEQFIDANVEFLNGQKKTYTFPTLNRKWKNFTASSGMLQFAGVPLIQPELTNDVGKDRETSIAFIEKVNDTIKRTMEDFVEKAKASFGQGNDSYSELYANKFSGIENQILQLKNSK